MAQQQQLDNEVDVLFEDQQKICTFNRLNTLFHELEDEIAALKEEGEKLKDACDEIYITDDIKYAVGEVFVDVEQDECESMLERQQKEVAKLIKEKEETINIVKNRMKQLKGELYAKFGKKINLEE